MLKWHVCKKEWILFWVCAERKVRDIKCLEKAGHRIKLKEIISWRLSSIRKNEKVIRELEEAEKV